ncbi:putative pentatricopeptide repeat-containing protein At3g05240 [Aristolochia californica]|uniref:putative pentatricopeptide repeat-containing protein At3g05240 n=1 Tax=Aristolochia californica TaxID=171875 RepID=UPI0035D6A03A
MRSHHAILSQLEKCKTMKELKIIQGLMITTSQVRNVIPLSRLIDFCVNPATGDLLYAQTIFLRVDHPSVYMWNSLIRGFSNADQQRKVLQLYEEMQRLAYLPDHFTFPFVLGACAKIPDHRNGECVHDRIVKTGFSSDSYVSGSLIHMYVSCADIERGRKVFAEIPIKNVVAWSTLIAGYVNNAQASEAVKVFDEMELAGVEPNAMTMVNVLVACGRSRDVETGKRVHSLICQRVADPGNPKSNWSSNIVLATALQDMYAKCGSLILARNLFDNLPRRNVVSWNSMISGYNQYGRASEALRLFSRMSAEGLKPDKVTLLSLMGACSQLGYLLAGQLIHAYIQKNGNHKDLAISTSLLDMYVKAGDTNSALQVFGGLERKDVKAWTSMITGLGVHGHGKEALQLFREMQGVGIVPDHITYIGVLCSCSRAGLVEEGREQFNSMKNEYGITPLIEHYGCMVDLLSRSGYLAEAERIIASMPVQPNTAIWGALLSGCKTYGNADIAERIGDQITQLNPHGSGIYLLLSHIFAQGGIWRMVERVRQLMKCRGVCKTGGYSSLQTKLLNP